MDFLLMRSKDFEDSARVGVLMGIDLARKRNLNVMLIVPQIQNLKDSRVLGETLGESNFKVLVKNRRIQLSGGNFLTVGLASDTTSLRRFNGVVIGVWATPDDAYIIADNATLASSIILTEWADGELEEWARHNSASVIDLGGTGRAGSLKELSWQVNHSNQLKIFNEQMGAVSLLVNSPVNEDAKFSFLVMLHAHLISAFEHFLSSTFIYHVSNSSMLTRRLFKADSDLAKQKLVLQEIYNQHSATKMTVAEYIKVTIADYLNSLVFHNVGVASSLYLKVLLFKLKKEEADWFVAAVDLRHDCVHRAGHTKDNKTINIKPKDIEKLAKNCQNLAMRIDEHMRDKKYEVEDTPED